MSVKLGEREWLMLEFIVQYRAAHYMIPPGVKEVFEYLNKKLPKRSKGGRKSPALASYEQVHRSATKLRQAGYLVNPDVIKELQFKPHNLIPTEEGIKALKQR